MTKIGAAKPENSHIWERQEHEHYVEPEWCSRRLFEVEDFHGQIWDPCCGFGRIPIQAGAAGHPHVYASDIVDRAYGGMNEIVDFLTCNDQQASPNIVCNPPFDIFRAFVEHALSLKATEKVAMIWLVRTLPAARWLRDTPLARIWLLTPRPSMPPGEVIARGEKPGGGKQDFCWLVWDREHKGAPTIGWLHRDEGYDARKDFGGSLDVAYSTIRERMAAGGPGWKPK